MKKIMLLIIVIIIFTVICSMDYKIEIPGGVKSVEIYSTNNSTYILDNATKTSCMGLEIYTTTYSHYKEVVDSLGSVESIVFVYGLIDIGDIVDSLKCKIIKIEQIDDRTVYYAYSKKIKQFTYIENERVNVHIVSSAKQIKVGIPLIIGSY